MKEDILVAQGLYKFYTKQDEKGIKIENKVKSTFKNFFIFSARRKNRVFLNKV